jgi:hypothetical protein
MHSCAKYYAQLCELVIIKGCRGLSLISFAALPYKMAVRCCLSVVFKTGETFLSQEDIIVYAGARRFLKEENVSMLF